MRPKSKSHELRCLKAELESLLNFESLPDSLSDRIKQEWLAYVYLYLAQEIHPNSQIVQILQAELMLNLQTAMQQLKDWFGNPQTCLSSVQVIDFDPKEICGEISNLAGQLQAQLNNIETHLDRVHPNFVELS